MSDIITIHIPPAPEPTIDPSDTYRVATIIGAADIIATMPDTGESTISADHPDAIPLPPLKFVNNGQEWPAMAERPITGCDHSGVSTIYIAM